MMPGLVIARRRVLLALALALAGCAGVPRLTPYGTRSIVLVYPWTGRRVAVTYRRNGVIDDHAMLDIAFLMRDRHTNEVHPIAPRLLDYMVDLRDRLGLPPDTPIDVINGYRTPERDALLARADPQVARGSYHNRGMAADIRIPGVDVDHVAAVAMGLHMGGVAYYRSPEHVHLDIGPPRTWSTRSAD